METKTFIHNLKNEVINSSVSEALKGEICRYLGRGLCKKATAEDCQNFLTSTQWPGVADADKLSAWWAVRQKEKNNGHPSQAKGGKKNITIEVTHAELGTLNYVRELLSLGVTLKDVTKSLAPLKAEAEKAQAEKANRAKEEREAFAKQYAEVFAQYKKLCEAEKTARSYTANHRRSRESYTPKETVGDIREAALAVFAAETEHRANSLF